MIHQNAQGSRTLPIAIKSRFATIIQAANYVRASAVITKLHWILFIFLINKLARMFEIKDELILFCWYYQGGHEFYFHDKRKAHLKKLNSWFTLIYSSGMQSGTASHALHEQQTFA